MGALGQDPAGLVIRMVVQQHVRQIGIRRGRGLLQDIPGQDGTPFRQFFSLYVPGGPVQFVAFVEDYAMCAGRLLQDGGEQMGLAGADLHDLAEGSEIDH